MSVLYYHIKTLISFECRRGSNPKSFILLFTIDLKFETLISVF